MKLKVRNTHAISTFGEDTEEYMDAKLNLDEKERLI